MPGAEVPRHRPAPGSDRAQADIRLQRVSKRYGSGERALVALRDIDLEVRHGEFLLLLGASGCGKTTLLRIMGGLLQPTSGELFIRDMPLWQKGGPNRDAMLEIGVVFQEANLFPWLTIEENVAMPLKLRGTGRSERLERARKLCELVGIGGFERRWPAELSGGMRQRAAIARALSSRPRILFMDEPFGALDAMTRDAMNLEIRRIWRESGCTVVMVTHSITEAVFLGNRVVVLTPRPGRIEDVIEVEFGEERELDLQSTAEFQHIVRRLRHILYTGAQ